MIAIIVPNWNGADFLEPCLKSLLQMDHNDFEVVVVDNGSVDASKDIIKQQFPQVTLIELDKNYGFAGGVNAGIKYALNKKAWAVALFNNDAVADKDWLRRLEETLRHSNLAAAVTSQFLNIDGKTIDSIGDYYSVWGLPFPKGRGQARQSDAKVLEVFGASGGASLYLAEALQDIGLFDEDFFAYYEDVDLSFRARLRGWKIYYQPAAIAFHHIGGTSSKLSGFSRYHSVKNLYFVYTKDMPTRLYWKYLFRFWIAMVLVAFNSVRNRQAWPMFKGSLMALLLFPKMVLKRFQIQHHRTISAKEIDALLYHSLPPTQVKAIRAFGKLPLISNWLISENDGD
ncbi:MAG TPA: glycosyltransferase family 2 protein [Candidatus Saccharimonadales bacterium]|nr:glycosyltransferase family 2 protein [Candidatus Saccharimonadales bacterium]